MNAVFKLCLAVLLVMSLAGMSRSPSEEVAEESPVESNKTQHATSGHRTVKPHANIELKYKLPKEWVIDTPEILHFTLVNGRDADDVKVSFTVDPGLILNTVPTEISFGPAPAGSRHGFDIQVTPGGNGLYYINLFASMLIEGRYQTRSFAIPVSVGEYSRHKQDSPAGVVTEDASGQKIISMPALETTD